MIEELPAVTVPPSFTKAGGRFRSLSGLTLSKASSVITGLGLPPCLPGTKTGVTSCSMHVGDVMRLVVPGSVNDAANVRDAHPCLCMFVIGPRQRVQSHVAVCY